MLKKLSKPTSLTIRSYIKLNLGKDISKNLKDEQKTGPTKLGGRRDHVFHYFCKKSFFQARIFSTLMS